MATRTFKPKREDMLTDWQAPPEKAPSLVRDEGQVIPRLIALVGVLLTAMGGLALLAPLWGLGYLIGPVLGFCFLLFGLGALFFHAFSERDLQFHLLYAFLGVCLVGNAIAFRIL